MNIKCILCVLGDVQLPSSEASLHVAIQTNGKFHSTKVGLLQNMTPTTAHKIILTNCLLSANSCTNTYSQSLNEL